MIVADTSALIAVMLQEDGHRPFETFIERSGRMVIAAPTKFEFMMVAEGRFRGTGSEAAKDFLGSRSIESIAWTDAHAQLAAEAFRRYGKGRHPARLNFGDCMAYALARSLDAPLLFKGGDFAATDITPAFTVPLTGGD